MNELEVIKPEVIEPNALQLVARAEIDSQITTAKQYPRTLSAVKKSMLEFATLDQETAESCFYTLPRGGKNIQGPSVRLAEIAVSCFQNLRAGARVIQTVTTGETPHVIVQAICHDLQNNVAITIEKRRRIVGKKKNDGKVDEDDINLATNACAAIAFRDAVFKVVPGALIKPVYEQAIKTAVGDAKTLADRRVSAVEKFAKMGVTKDRVLAKLERKSIEDITLEDLEVLFGLFTSIKDNQTNIDEAFPAAVATKPKFEEKAGADRLLGKAKPQEPAAKTEPANPTDDMVDKITKLLATAKQPESNLISYMRQTNMADDSLSSIREIAEASPTALRTIIEKWGIVSKALESL